MKRYVAFVAVAAVALVLIALPASAITGVNGTATTDNTILQVKVGNTIVKLASDLAESLNTTSTKATGRFLYGQVGDFVLGGSGKTPEKTATKASDSGSETIGTGTKSAAGLASITLSSGTVAASVAKTKVNSAVDFVIANVDALAGFTHIGTTTSSTDSSVGVGSSVVSRDISIGKVNVLNLRDLLDQLNVDPLAMDCDAIANTAAGLGVDASAACAATDDVWNKVADTGAIPDGLTEIDDTDDVITTLESALAVPCGLVPGLCDQLLAVGGDIDDIQDTIAGIQADPGSTCVAVEEQIADVASNLDTVIATLNGLTSDPTVGATLATLLTPLTDQADALDAATTALDDACNTLLGIVDDLLDTSILSLDLVNVSMDLAAKSSPSAVAQGAIGSLKVGNLTVVSANDLVALGSQLNSAIDTVESALGTVFDATGLGLAAPSLDLLKTTTSKGKNAAGSFFANADMTVAHLAVPAATLNLPASLPLGMLGGLGSFAPASIRVAAVNTPAVSVDAGVFSGSATYKAGAVLPVTGVADSGLVLAGMLTLIGAGMVRRIKTLFN
jgi:hypothetical protein